MLIFNIIAVLLIHLCSFKLKTYSLSEPSNDITKEEIATESYKLQEDVKSLDESKKLVEDLTNEHAKIDEELKESPRNVKLEELLRKRDELLIKISSLSKTLRLEHDNLYPELRDQPIIVVAKNKDDNKLIANQLAHIDGVVREAMKVLAEGLEDFVNDIRSPCNILENLRIKSLDATENTIKDRFVIEQRTLDSMNIKERLNYGKWRIKNKSLGVPENGVTDSQLTEFCSLVVAFYSSLTKEGHRDRNMIEHYESIMQELERGIEAVNNEITSSWRDFE